MICDLIQKVSKSKFFYFYLRTDFFPSNLYNGCVKQVEYSRSCSISCNRFTHRWQNQNWFSSNRNWRAVETRTGDKRSTRQHAFTKVCSEFVVELLWTSVLFDRGLGRIKATGTVRVTFHDELSNVNSLPKGVRVNSARYTATPRSVTALLRQVRLARKICEMQLLCDEARPSPSVHFTETITHPPYSAYNKIITTQTKRIPPTIICF